MGELIDGSWQKTPMDIFNPHWPPHAKFHDGQTILLGAWLGIVTIGFAWRRGQDGGNALTAFAFGVAYWVTQLAAALFPGARYIDPGSTRRRTTCSSSRQRVRQPDRARRPPRGGGGRDPSRSKTVRRSGLFAAAAALALLAGSPLAAQTAAPVGPSSQLPAAKSDAASAQDAPSGKPDPRRLLLPMPAEEDWSFLADPQARTEPLDALKYVPIGAGGAYVSFGGEARSYVESIRNENFGQFAGSDTYPEFRVILHADVHPTANLRFYVSTQSSFIGNRQGGPRPSVDRDQLDLLEGFAEYHSSAFNPTLKGPAFTLRLGRQQFDFGAGRLLSSREGPNGEGPNVLQGFDGGRVILRSDAWRLDLFAGKPTDTRPGVFNDGWLKGQGVWGAYLAHGGPPGAPGLGEEVFYIGTRRPAAPFFAGVADETRHSVGARVFQRGTPFSYDLEAIYQFGSFGSRDVSAYGLTAEATYTFEHVAWTPEPGIRVGVDSGGASAGTLKTFYVPFPRGTYFGYLSAIGPENTSGIEGVLSLHLTKMLTVTGGAFFFWRQSLNDGLYGLPGFPLLPPTNRKRYAGAQPVFSSSWQASPHLSLNAAYERFDRGDFISATPGTKSIDYFAAWANFRF